MALPRSTPLLADIHYPQSDGLPMSDNTLQFRWIVTLFGNLAGWFRNRADVFVCGNQNWYPVEGHPEIVVAPDVYVVFGRPKGDRPSWKQWEEENTPMTVVFEVLSPGNTRKEMQEKRTFYDRHGVEEYYLYDPEGNHLEIYLRQGKSLRPVTPGEAFVSPRLGIRFQLAPSEVRFFLPDGRPFRTFEETVAESREAQELAERERVRADEQHALALQEEARAEREKLRAERERVRADEQHALALQEKTRAEREEARAEQERQVRVQMQLQVQRLIRLSEKSRQGRATPEELQELTRLEQALGDLS